MPKNNEIAVLDIGSVKIRAAIAEKSGLTNITVRGVGEAEYSGFSAGQWLEPSEIKQAILSAVYQAESASGSKIRRILVGVPSEFSYSICKEAALFFNQTKKITDREIELLCEKSDKFADDHAYETVNISPVYFLLGNNKRIVEPRGILSDQLKALVSYVRCGREFTEHIKACFASMNIEVKFVSDIWAEAMYLFEPEQREKYILFADVGYITTSLILMRSDGILHLSSSSIGGGYITADISEVFGISFQEAERVKRSVNLAHYSGSVKVSLSAPSQNLKEVPVKDINNVVCARLEDIADAVKRGIQNSVYDCPPYLTLYITGGGISYINGAKDFISELIGRNVEIIAPNVPAYNKPHFSALIGLIGEAHESLAKTKKGIGKLFSFGK